MDYSKENLFNMLLHSVHNCDLCERLCSRKKVLSKYSGNLHSKVLFIAEAPGRLGADCTGIPLYGDKTGDNFEILLNNIGWSRNDVFITNAVLCNPQDENGNNSTPKSDEIINCSTYLRMTIKLINPEVIVTLGAKALEALKRIHEHEFTLKSAAGTYQKWDKYILYPLYHMGPRALVHRPLAEQRADFIKLSHYIDPMDGIKKKNRTQRESQKQNDRLLPLAKLVVDFCNELSLFKLTKLLYLIDYTSLKQFGNSISGSVFLRMQEGPWIPSLSSLINNNKRYFSVFFIKKQPYVHSTTERYEDDRYSTTEKELVLNVLRQYATLSDSELKTVVYLTKPMRYILREEKKGENMLRIPVLYRDDTVINLHDTRPTEDNI